MRFNSVKSVMKIEKGINLFDGKGKLTSHLEMGRHPLHFTSSRLAIASLLDGDLFGEIPFTDARPRTVVSGDLIPRDLNLNCFKERSFLGPVPKTTFYFSEGEEYHLMGRVWGPDESIDPVNTLHISAVLPKDMFREVFHPIWVRQNKSILTVTLNVIGYQEGIEMAFGEPGDVENIIVEAGADIGAKLATIQLTTQLQ